MSLNQLLEVFQKSDSTYLSQKSVLFIRIIFLIAVYKKLFGSPITKRSHSSNSKLFLPIYDEFLDEASKEAAFHIISSCVPRYMYNIIQTNRFTQIPPGYKTCEAIIGFFDFTGYTRLAELLSQRERRTTFGNRMDRSRSACIGAEELMKVLNDYFTEIIRIIHDNGGDVVKFAGDAVLVWWPIETDSNRTKWSYDMNNPKSFNCGKKDKKKKKKEKKKIDNNNNNNKKKENNNKSNNKKINSPTSDTEEDEDEDSDDSEYEDNNEDILKEIKTKLSESAIITCYSIIRSLHRLNNQHDLELKIKLGLALGETTFLLFQSKEYKRNECLISGDVIKTAGLMAEKSNSVYIGISNELFTYIPDVNILGPLVKIDGGYLVKNDIDLPIGFIPDYNNSGLSNYNNSNYNFNTRSNSNNNNNNNNNNLNPLNESTKSFKSEDKIVPLLPKLQTYKTSVAYCQSSIPFQIQPILLSFIPLSIRDSLQAGPGSTEATRVNRHVDAYTGWISEIRRLSIMFILFPSFKCSPEQYEIVNEMYQIVMKSIKPRKGILRQFIVDDKGCVMICVFGLNSVLGYASYAVKSAMEILEKLEDINVPISIGITTGICYCGVIGSANRCEYTISGDIVNLSARIMVQGKKMMEQYNRDNIILCDEETRNDSKNLIYYEYKSKIKVKGKEVLINIYEPFELVYIGGEDVEYLTEEDKKWIHPEIWRAGIHSKYQRTLQDVDGENNMLYAKFGKMKRTRNSIHSLPVSVSQSPLPTGNTPSVCGDKRNLTDPKVMDMNNKKNFSLTSPLPFSNLSKYVTMRPSSSARIGSEIDNDDVIQNNTLNTLNTGTNSETASINNNNHNHNTILFSLTNNNNGNAEISPEIQSKSSSPPAPIAPPPSTTSTKSNSKSNSKSNPKSIFKSPPLTPPPDPSQKHYNHHQQQQLQQQEPPPPPPPPPSKPLQPIHTHFENNNNNSENELVENTSSSISPEVISSKNSSGEIIKYSSTNTNSNNNNNNNCKEYKIHSMATAVYAVQAVFTLGSSVQLAKYLERMTSLPLMILKVCSVVALFRNRIHFALLNDILPMKSFKPLLKATLDELVETGILVTLDPKATSPQHRQKHRQHFFASGNGSNLSGNNNNNGISGENNNNNNNNKSKRRSKQQQQQDTDSVVLSDFLLEDSNMPIYRFKHEHAIEVLHEQLLSSQRQDLHNAVATWYEKSVGNRLSEMESQLYAVIAYHWSMSPEERIALAKSVLYMHLAAKTALREQDWNSAIDYLLKTLELLDANKKYGLNGFTIAFDAPLAHCYLARAYSQINDYDNTLRHIKISFELYHAPIPSIRDDIYFEYEGVMHNYSLNKGCRCFKKKVKYYPTNTTPVEDIISLYELYIQLKNNTKKKQCISTNPSSSLSSKSML